MKIIISIISLLFLFSSCGGDSSSNPNNINPDDNNSDFFPLKIGTWWKYKESYDPSSNSFQFDSIFVSRTLPVNGKEAYEFVSYYIDPETNSIVSQDTNYYYKEGPNVYRLIQNYYTNEKEWMLYINVQLEYIKVYEYDAEFPWNNGKFVGVERMERIVEGPEKFYLGEQTINCIKTKLMVSYIGDYIVDEKKEPMNEVLITTHQWYGYKVGLVKNYWENDEFDQILIDFYVP